MSWNTPSGVRVLDKVEAKLIGTAIYAMSSVLTISPISAAGLETDVPVFDELSDCQKLVMLDYAKTFLLSETPEENAMTSVVEGTAGAILEFVDQCIGIELSDESKRMRSLAPAPSRHWRRLLYKVSKAYKWELTFRTKSDWQTASDLLFDRILWDNDYMSHQATDPNADNDYYAHLVVEPDGAEMLEIIRRLTAQPTR